MSRRISPISTGSAGSPLIARASESLLVVRAFVELHLVAIRGSDSGVGPPGRDDRIGHDGTLPAQLVDGGQDVVRSKRQERSIAWLFIKAGGCRQNDRCLRIRGLDLDLA